MKVVVVLVVLAAVGAGLYVAFGEPAEPLPAARPIDPPADAVFLEEGVQPGAVIMTYVGARTLDERDGVRDAFVGVWTPDGRTWDGEVARMGVRDGVTWFSVELHGPTLIGMCYVVCEVPGSVEGLKEGRLVRFRGRIKDIEESPDVRTTPHRLIMDQVTVERVG